MKGILSTLFIALILSGCATMAPKSSSTPTSNPAQHATKYAFQIIEIEGIQTSSNTDLDSSAIERLQKNNQSLIHTYPILYVTPDIPESLPTDTTEASKSIDLLITQIEGDQITYDLKLERKILLGHEEYPLGNGRVRSTPIIEVREMNNTLTQPVSDWACVGATVSSIPEKNTLFCVRILPPSN